jgi:hypothetical protein
MDDELEFLRRKSTKEVKLMGKMTLRRYLFNLLRRRYFAITFAIF